MAKQQKQDNLMIVAGEHSGDLLGGELMHELNRHGRWNFYGVGGKNMAREGMESAEDIENMTVVGFSGILSKYSFLKSLLNRLVKEALARNIKTAVMIDYPGFNLRLARELKKHGIKIVYYVSPQIWAWKFKRIFLIREIVDLMLLLLPFEKKIYDDYSVPNVYIGHPVFPRIPGQLKNENRQKLKKSGNTKITLMPGSRTSEIRKLLDDLLAAAKIIDGQLEGKADFFLPNISEKEEDFILEKIASSGLSVHYCKNCSLDRIESSDLVLLSSGTATLEVAWFEKPMVIIYKVSPLTWFLGKLLVRTRFIGLVNIIAGKEVIKELLQHDCNPEAIAAEALRILTDKKYRNSMVADIKKVKKSLSVKVPPYVAAAREIIRIVKSS